MNQEHQRIKIAEACGFSNINSVCWRGNAALHERQIPNYPEDLNAMHEAVHSRITSPELQQEYFYQLNDAIGLVDSFSPAWIKEFAVFAHSQATAAQRAEAFLRTLDLWEE